MNLLQLEYFQEVAKAQSITKAAKALNISQSALSVMMGKLENELGYPLFTKQGRNIAITPYGQKVVHYSYILLHQMDDIKREFRELRGEDNELTISLGVTDSNFYGDWILALLDKAPDLKLNILQMPREEIYNNLLTGNLDFGISNGREYHNQISSRLLFSQPYQLLVFRDHPLAEKGRISLEELAEEPLISLSPTHKERLIDNLMQETHFHPNIIFEGNPDIMTEMFHARMGSILTCAHNRKQWMRLAPENYAALTITGVATRYEMYLLWSKHRFLSKWARVFQDYVFDYYHV